MKEEMMTTGFTGGDTATGPTAGFDPVLKMRAKRKALKGLVAPGNKLSDGKKKIKENAVDKYAPKSRLFQYKVSLPEVGDTVVYASSPAELRQKLRLLINYRYRGDIEIERILPANAYKFFTDKRQKHLRNVQEKACWKGYKKVGTKKKGDKIVNDCVKETATLDEVKSACKTRLSKKTQELKNG